MLEELLVIVLFFGPVIGTPILAIGVILRLCEGSWGKVKGSMGSAMFLGVGALLSLPAVIYCLPGLLAHFFR